MTLDEARSNINAAVVYRPAFGLAEDGVITGVSARFVFVRYRVLPAKAIATAPELLTLMSV